MRLHYCDNKVSVTDQVIRYQKNRTNANFLPIKRYYDNYKEVWFKQICDYLDKDTFNSDFEFKLLRAVNGFDEKEAKKFASKYGWSFIGMFNRWFYRILSNWKSNIKTSSFRIKRRPPVICPVCNRLVGKIDVEHLKHFKTSKDLPRFLEYKGMIYPVYINPRKQAMSYGYYYPKKLENMNNGSVKRYLKKKKPTKWPWFTEAHKKGVICPFSKKIIVQINEDYIKTLPKKYRHYAKPITWQDFIELHPSSLIQSEIFSLDFSNNENEDSFGDQVVEDFKCQQTSKKSADLFDMIDMFVDNKQDREITKMFASGYSTEDISKIMQINKPDIKRRIGFLKDNAKDLETAILELV